MDRISPADQSTANQPTAETSPSVESTVDRTDDRLESRIDPATDAVLRRYFETFNAGDFAATAALFAPEGAMYPPFESAVVGPEAIESFLSREARGMTIEARQSVQETAETGETEVNVAGKVQTPLFGVNVRWTFELNDSLEIVSVRIKLLAALEDLLKLKQ